MNLKPRSEYFTMADDGTPSEGAGGNAGTPPPAAPPAANSQFVLPENWRDTLPADLKEEPSLKLFNDFPAIVKSLVHAQKAMGSDKVVKPSKHATDDEWKQFFKSVGAPQDPKEYTLEIAKEDADEGFLENYKRLAAENQLFPKQAQAVLAGSLNFLKQVQQQLGDKQKGESEAAIKALKQEWGAAYDKNVNKAQAAFKKFGDEGLQEYMEKSGLGNDPRVLKAFAKIGDLISEDEIKGGAAEGGDAMTPAEAQKRANEILMDSKHPHNLAGHPNHKAAVQEMKQLYEYMYPEEKEN